MSTPPTLAGALFNPSFEDGDSGWLKTTGGGSYSPTGTDWTITNSPPSPSQSAIAGSWLAITDRPGNGTHIGRGLGNGQVVPVYPGQTISASCSMRAQGSSKSHGQIVITWLNSSFGQLSNVFGTVVGRGSSSTGTWQTSRVTATAPPNARYAQLYAVASLEQNGTVLVDNFSWNYTYNRTVALTQPTTGATFDAGANIAFQCTTGGTTPPVARVEYYANASKVTESTVAPYSATWFGAPSGSYTVLARMVGTDGSELDSSTAGIVVGAAGLVIVSPTDGSNVSFPGSVAIRANFTGAPDLINNVVYTINGDVAGTVTTEPYVLNWAVPALGVYEIEAEAFLDTTSVATAAPVEVTALDATVREFNNSNSRNYLVLNNIRGPLENLAPNAQITGLQVVINGRFDIAGKLLDIDRPADEATPITVFGAIKGAIVEVLLLRGAPGSYRVVGTSLLTDVELAQDQFTLEEDGFSGTRKWVLWQGAEDTYTFGGDISVFGVDSLSYSEIRDLAVAIRVLPLAGTRPEYADAGEAVLRSVFNRARIQFSYRSGGTAYYYVSGSGDVVEAELTAYYVDYGNLRTGDARGSFQITNLELVEGTDSVIDAGWTVHTALPPSGDNQIAVVSSQMEYNGLAPTWKLTNTQSNYQFITSNFYGDVGLNSVYGVSGAGRAFTYNDRFYHFIQTQPDENKDMPRHVSNHHHHLALGFPEGRVDVSVVGEPFNFDGALGASSWAVGDSVTGLLPLSGTALGVFCKKSIWALQGTTLDNFATQVLSPNIGAIEYSVCDMGYPMYCNQHGIYNLQRTAAYGDFAGEPLSKPINDWLKPRIVNGSESANGIATCYPVRSKNQYRLVFKDGYQLTTTMESSDARPVFTIQLLQTGDGS